MTPSGMTAPVLSSTAASDAIGITLNAPMDSIGSIGNPILVNGLLNIDINNTSGNLYLQSQMGIDLDTLLPGPVDTNGVISITATTEDIIIVRDITASEITLTSREGNILRTGGTITSTSTSATEGITLDAPMASIGTAANPIRVSSTSGVLNIDINNTSGSLYLQSQRRIDLNTLLPGTVNTSGVISITATTGDITIVRDITASEITLISSAGSILRTGGSLTTSSTSPGVGITLSAPMGDIGGSVSRILIQRSGNTSWATNQIILNGRNITIVTSTSGILDGAIDISGSTTIATLDIEQNVGFVEISRDLIHPNSSSGILILRATDTSGGGNGRIVRRGDSTLTASSLTLFASDSIGTMDSHIQIENGGVSWASNLTLEIGSRGGGGVYISTSNPGAVYADLIFPVGMDQLVFSVNSGVSIDLPTDVNLSGVSLRLSVAGVSMGNISGRGTIRARAISLISGTPVVMGNNRIGGSIYGSDEDSEISIEKNNDGSWVAGELSFTFENSLRVHSESNGLLSAEFNNPPTENTIFLSLNGPALLSSNLNVDHSANLNLTVLSRRSDILSDDPGFRFSAMNLTLRAPMGSIGTELNPITIENSNQPEPRWERDSLTLRVATTGNIFIRSSSAGTLDGTFQSDPMSSMPPQPLNRLSFEQIGGDLDIDRLVDLNFVTDRVTLLAPNGRIRTIGVDSDDRELRSRANDVSSIDEAPMARVIARELELIAMVSSEDAPGIDIDGALFVNRLIVDSEHVRLYWVESQVGEDLLVLGMADTVLTIGLRMVSDDGNISVRRFSGYGNYNIQPTITDLGLLRILNGVEDSTCPRSTSLSGEPGVINFNSCNAVNQTHNFSFPTGRLFIITEEGIGTGGKGIFIQTVGFEDVALSGLPGIDSGTRAIIIANPTNPCTNCDFLNAVVEGPIAIDAIRSRIEELIRGNYIRVSLGDNLPIVTTSFSIKVEVDFDRFDSSAFLEFSLYSVDDSPIQTCPDQAITPEKYEEGMASGGVPGCDESLVLSADDGIENRRPLEEIEEIKKGEPKGIAPVSPPASALSK